MKKQSMTGWAYPCDNIFEWDRDKLLKLDLPPAKFKRVLTEEQEECTCGKRHQPIKVRVTVEPVGGEQ